MARFLGILLAYHGLTQIYPQPKGSHMKKLLLVLTLSVFSLSSFAADINCGGTEPFWSASVKNGILKYNDPTVDKAVSLKVIEVKDAAGYTPGNIQVIKTKFTRLSLVLGQCNDGMSDEVYSHHAIYEKDGVVFGGCCNVK